MTIAEIGTQDDTTQLIHGVCVPESLLRDPEAFGGRSHDGCRIGSLSLNHGQIVGMSSSAHAPRHVLLPRLSEAHVHLDKCHTIERCTGVGGDLAAAAASQLRDKENWTTSDLEHRMRRGLDELVGAGCGALRSHIDWDARSDRPPLAWEVGAELLQDARKNGVVLQLAALTGVDDMADKARADRIAKTISETGGVLGSFVLHHADARAGIEACFAAADRYGLALDFHVDESLDPALRGLDMIVETAKATRFEGPILCGHACTLSARPLEEVLRLADGLAETGISIATLPTTNLYLQGRGSGTPGPRGLTRVQELEARGVNVVVGTDNVRDAFCPIGRHDPRHSLAIASLGAHLDPPLAQHLPKITTNAQRALGLAETYVDTAEPSDLLLFDAPDITTLLSDALPPRPLSDFLSGERSHG